MNELTKRPNILKILNRVGRNEDMFSSLVDDMFHFHGFSPFREIPNPSFSPALDFVDKEKEYNARIELPGIEENKIDVEIDDEIIIIKGEKKSETEEEKDDMYICERCFGSFRREIKLPKDCNKDKIEATYKNGILNLKIPKLEIKEKEKKKIDIKLLSQ